MEQHTEVPESALPRASVVILAWKLVDELRHCLQSLAGSASAPAFEVIIVANGANEDVRTYLADEVSGARIVWLAENIGFGGGCNAGAAIARGEFVVFLNDDATVAADWLASLVDAADSTGAEAVASVLLNADGTLQEAGSRVRADAGTVQLGRALSLADAEDRGYLIRHEVDYGSGAALLVRRDVFVRLGGFDPLYRPAYYEDVDLSLRIKAGGGTVILEPTARVTHLSGGSTAGQRRFRSFASARSGRAFVERWAASLDSAPEPDAPLDETMQVFQPTIPQAAALTENEFSHPAATALEIQRSFAEWLDERLTEEEEAKSQSEHRRRELEEELRQLREQAELVGRRAAELAARLADLDSRGPIGIIAWKANVLRRNREARRLDS